MNANDFDFWMFFAGLGIFLFGMNHLELGIKGLAGRSFRKLMKRFTNRNWKGILTGTFVTAILQSSSLVNLLMLAFLGAGMIKLSNALGVIIGANLGTSFTAWIVAALGFKINIADFSYPFLGLGIFSYLFFNSRAALKNIGLFMIGFGLIFLGLDYMNDAMDQLAGDFNPTTLARWGYWAFVLMSLLITALIQSSSAMIVIIMSALNAQLLDINQSFAMVIGANIGTTSTLILGSLGGSSDKKRLALAHVIFNVTTGILAFLFIESIVGIVQKWFYLTDMVLELVILNTLFNLAGIIIFYPFIQLLKRLLVKIIKEAESKGKALYIDKVPPNVPEIALDAIQKELLEVYDLYEQFVQACFEMKATRGESGAALRQIFAVTESLHKKYEDIKNMEDELTQYYSVLQEQHLSEEESRELSLSMQVMRSLVYGTKDIKDVIHNIRQINDTQDELGMEILSSLRAFLMKRLMTFNAGFHGKFSEKLPDDVKSNQQYYEESIEYLYNNIRKLNRNQVPVSTITNVIKQSISSVENVSQAIHYWKEIQMQFSE